jgi:hypothetical protein
LSTFKDEQPFQRLDLEAPNRDVPLEQATAFAEPAASIRPTPARTAEIRRRVQQILTSGQAPEWIFVCQIDSGLLGLPYAPDKNPALLLFTDQFAAQDYVRATHVTGRIGQIKLESLPEMARDWVSAGIEHFVLNRCPRCPHFKLIKTAALRTKQDFVVFWAAERAARWLYGEILFRSASDHIKSGSHAKARADLEYIRDHLNCAIPYLHQLIGLLADVQRDEAARIAADERLKEFGNFEGTTKFSIEAFSAAAVGLMMNLGMLPNLPGPGSPTANAAIEKV